VGGGPKPRQWGTQKHQVTKIETQKVDRTVTGGKGTTPEAEKTEARTKPVTKNHSGANRGLGKRKSMKTGRKTKGTGKPAGGG